MGKNIRKNLKNTKGITLIALVITIIVLLILAGISLSMVLNQNGIFDRTEQATTKYGKEKSREALELVLGEVKMMKYEEKPDAETYDQKLDEQLNKIGQIEGGNKDEVIVEGHIWKIDRDEPKILDYLGEADGIEIRYTITGNETWTKEAKTITSNVAVKNNKGALDISSIKITKKVGNGSETDITSSIVINSNGTFALTTAEVSETIFKVSAKNSKGKQSTPRTIKIIPKIDTIAPTLSNATATADGMKIKISVNATDDKSGVGQINYSMSPATVKNSAGESAGTGTLTSGQILVLTAETEGEYTVTFTATDNVGNTTTPGGTASKVTAIDGISMAELKTKVTASTWKDLVGTKVYDYKSDDTKEWRVFYYDENNHFGDGAGTIYLKRDYDSTTTTTLSSYTNYTPSDEGKIMKQLNKDWAESDYSAIDNANEHCVAWLCDSGVWNPQYKVAGVKYVVGAPSVEMFMRAYNESKDLTGTSNELKWGIQNEYGYGLAVGSVSLAKYIDISIDSGKGNVFCILNGYQWLASPSSYDDKRILDVNTKNAWGNPYDNNINYCPVACIPQ